MIDYFVWIILHLGAWALMLLASAGAGLLFLRDCRFDSLLERAVFTIAAGLGCWGVLLFLLGLAGLLYTAVIIGLTVAAATATAVYLLRSYRHAHFKLPDWRWLVRPRGLLIVSVVIIGVTYWLLLLLLTQYPPMNWDSVAYHLVLAKEYLRNHSIIVHDGIAVPVVPALNHILFTWGLAMKDDVMAQMIEHTFMMLTALGTFAWGRRQSQPWMGLAAAALWLGHPLIVWLGEAAYVDLGVTCFIFLGLYALRVFRDSREVTWWYLAMSLLGMAAAVKLPGLFFVGLASALGLWTLLRPRLKWGLLRSLKRPDLAEQKNSHFNWRSLVVGWALALAFTAPFYGFIAYATGNPFWPGLPELSQGIWRVGAETFWSQWGNVGTDKSLVNLLSLPVLITLNPETFLPDNNRLLLPIIIAWPLAWVVSFINRSVRWWTLWALAFTAFWFMSTQQLRLWVPALPMVGLGLYESIGWLLDKIPRLPAISRAAVWTALSLFSIAVCTREIIQELDTKGWTPPVTQNERDRYLTNLVTGYGGVKYINRRAQENESVYVMNGSWLDYHLKPYALDMRALLQQISAPTFRWPQDERWTEWLKSRNVNWILINHVNIEPFARLPHKDPIARPFWPEYRLVYRDATTWVFRRT